MDLTTTSHYDRKTATVRAEEGTTREGQAYLYVSDAQLAAAATRAHAVSGDHMTLPEVEGYSEWQTVEGGMACYRLKWAAASRCAWAPGPIHYYETPDDPCRAVCAACDYHCQREGWAGWELLDPATLDGVDPTHCEHCGAPIFAEAPETGQDCHSVWGQLARRAVACYRSEFPGEGPDWDSDWWYGWRDVWETPEWPEDGGLPEDGEFSRFLAACKATWAATRDGQDGIGGERREA